MFHKILIVLIQFHILGKLFLTQR